jgi:hypothetical protein
VFRIMSVVTAAGVTSVLAEEQLPDSSAALLQG